MWPKSWRIYLIESLSIILLALISLSLQNGRFDLSIVFSNYTLLSIVGSLCLWFTTRVVLDRLLQARINANRVTQYLPFELTIASIVVTTLIYLVFYPIFILLTDLDFEVANFLRGLFATCAFSLLIVILYAGSQVWMSWWSDGEFLFKARDEIPLERKSENYITLEHSKGSIKYDLGDVAYFFSESKIAFLVDATGRKRMTQFALSELEEILGDRFFRLNRKTLVSRGVISEIEKLPNHRLLVSVSNADSVIKESVSRYKSTRFKQWINLNAKTVDH